MSMLFYTNMMKASLMSFPNDETGNVLAEMHQAGVDLTKPIVITYFQLFEEKRNAKAMYDHLLETDMKLTISLHPDQTPNVWDLDCSLTMIPTYENVNKFEEIFEKTARKFDGYNDGWGAELED